MISAPAIYILAVDDEPAVLEMIAEYLGVGGYHIIQAGSARAALAALDERSSELGGLVTDVNLGDGESGWDIGRRARELNPSLPVVYITGDSAEQWSAHGVPHSVLLNKPFASADLVGALASLRKTD